MNRKSRIAPQDVVVMSTVQHLTPAEIAVLAGISRQQVGKILRTQGINTSKGPGGACRVIIECAMCGKTMEISRKKWGKWVKHYCSNECYYASRSNPNYYQWRHGSRIARIIISQYYPIQPEHVVHHIDGDERNNDRDNLLLFASHSDHMKHHHGKNHVEPIWDGRKV